MRHARIPSRSARRSAPARASAARQDANRIGRSALSLFDPNWPLHAELELGGGNGEIFASWPKQYGWWLERRTMSKDDLVNYLTQLLWSGLSGAGLERPREESRDVPAEVVPLTPRTRRQKSGEQQS